MPLSQKRTLFVIVKNTLKLMSCFLVSVLVMYGVGILHNSLDNAFHLVRLEAPMTFSLFKDMFINDLIHFRLYGFFIVVSCLLSFSLASIVSKWIPIKKHLLFSIAGAIALFGLLSLLNIQLNNIVIISSTRHPIGMGAQSCIGLLGGFVFAILLERTFKIKTLSNKKKQKKEFQLSFIEQLSQVKRNHFLSSSKFIQAKKKSHD